ncbi:hypothetical protein GCM10023317_58640 [Actinopolymorpha pittospori]|uniref:Uncharacterized protein n=1 Tax=Actinopolymorpha pittospori TaxID=648752 RepID=A0A927RFV0_9ACTN|nr:hypothetical protein [Actinopolymorpha pittospori]
MVGYEFLPAGQTQREAQGDGALPRSGCARGPDVRGKPVVRARGSEAGRLPRVERLNDTSEVLTLMARGDQAPGTRGGLEYEFLGVHSTYQHDHWEPRPQRR